MKFYLKSGLPMIAQRQFRILFKLEKHHTVEQSGGAGGEKEKNIDELKRAIECDINRYPQQHVGEWRRRQNVALNAACPKWAPRPRVNGLG